MISIDIWHYDNHIIPVPQQCVIQCSNGRDCDNGNGAAVMTPTIGRKFEISLDAAQNAVLLNIYNAENNFVILKTFAIRPLRIAMRCDLNFALCCVVTKIAIVTVLPYFCTMFISLFFVFITIRLKQITTSTIFHIFHKTISNQPL